MAPNLSQSFEKAAEKLNVELISFDEARTMRPDLNEYMVSFSKVSGGRRMTFLDPDDHEGDDEAAYFVGLHELGHHAMGHTLQHPSDFTFEEIVDKEIEAWQWAFENAEIEFSDSAFHVMFDSLSTYTDELEERNRTPDEFERFLEALFGRR